VDCTAPALADDGAWVALVDTARDDETPRRVGDGALAVDGFSLVLLRHGAERRMSLAGATAEGAALVNTMAVGGGAAFTGAEQLVRDLVRGAGAGDGAGVGA
jgi:hypothetical protein